jgi:hypothetical protein
MESSPTTEPLVTETPVVSSISSSMNFWKIWSANSFSNLGDGLYQITLPLLGAQLTRSLTCALMWTVGLAHFAALRGCFAKTLQS